MNYDMELLERLNEEYKHKPIVSNFIKYDHESQFELANHRLADLEKKIDLKGKKVLEIGCGGGYISRKLATDYDCDVIGTDIYKSEVWSELGEEKNLAYRVVDLSSENPFELNSFDMIISYCAWEHIRHPFKVLQECVKLIKPSGDIYIYANLYRSALASHLYRTIHFPYPHILFPDEVIIEYCLKNGVTQDWIDAYYYVNKLSYCHYKEYFRILNLKVKSENLFKRKLDLEFYKRFEEKLGLYPIFDLELDFFEVILCIDDKNIEFNERKSITSYKIKCDKVSPQNAGVTLKWSVEAFGIDLQYAWYIYKDYVRVDTIWYSEQNFIYQKPTDPGVYKVKVFIKDSNENKVSDISEEFVINN